MRAFPLVFSTSLVLFVYAIPAIFAFHYQANRNAFFEIQGHRSIGRGLFVSTINEMDGTILSTRPLLDRNKATEQCSDAHLSTTPSTITNKQVQEKTELKMPLIATDENGDFATATLVTGAKIQNTNRRKPTLATWKRRLNTKEDRFNLHKISNVGYTLSSLAILGTGLATNWSEIPAFLEPYIYMFFASTMLQGLSSIEMKLAHRKKGFAHEGFLGLAFVTMQTAFIGVWESPLSPDFVHDSLFFWSVMIPLSLGEVLMEFSKDTYVDDEFLEVNEQSLEERIEHFLQVTIPRFVTVFFDLMYIPILALLCLNESSSMAGNGLYAYFQELYAGVQPNAFYSIFLVSITGGFGGFMVTLVEKKLMTLEKSFELAYAMVLLNLWVFLPILPGTIEFFVDRARDFS